MAHKIKIKTKPHINKDGTKSESRLDYFVTHKHRHNPKVLVGVFTSRAKAEEAVREERTRVFGPQS